MTDGQVLAAVDRAKQTFKTAETKANRQFRKAKERAMSFYGSTDVERASRHNEIKRAEAVLDAEVADARIAFIDRLEQIRSGAGEWADLVPRVR